VPCNNIGYQFCKDLVFAMYGNIYFLGCSLAYLFLLLVSCGVAVTDCFVVVVVVLSTSVSCFGACVLCCVWMMILQGGVFFS
jgi:hypothetical protein